MEVLLEGRDQKWSCNCEGGTTNEGVTGRGHKWRCNWEGGRDCEEAPMGMKLGGD